MLRTLGLIILALAAVVTVQRTLTPFDLEVGSRFEGDDVLPVMERCGRAIPILLSPETEMADLGPNFSGDCTRAARTRALEGAAVAGIGVASAWILFSGRWSRPKPMHRHLRPLPKPDGEVIGRRGRHREPGD